MFINKKEWGILLIIFPILFFISFTSALDYDDWGYNDPTLPSIPQPEVVTITFNNNTGAVNTSQWWDDKDTHNATQMETSDSKLNILVSWLKSLFYTETEIDTNYVPYIGASNNINLGNFNITNLNWVSGDYGNFTNLIGAGVPVNAIMSFNQASCPTGWILADGSSGTPDLRGIFVRGAGTSGTYKMANGTSFSATYGEFMNDSFQGHEHSLNVTSASGNSASSSTGWLAQTTSTGGTMWRTAPNSVNPNVITPPKIAQDGTPRYGGETRPASYTLIYCQKTTEDSVTSNTIWGESGDNIFVQNTSKNVGIGTVNPTHTLNVVGDSNFTENATFEKDVTIGGTLYGGSPVRIDGINISNNLFSHRDNINESLKFKLKNVNDSTNASTTLSAINDVGGSMSIGIGSSKFMIGSTNYKNATALFSRSRGKMVFANFFNQMFLWLYNPSDDNDPKNLVEIMRLDENGLNVTGDVTAENVFVPQYIFVHDNRTTSLTGAGVWANITFDQEVADIKKGIGHTFNDATNYTFVINEAGIYDITFDFDAIDTSASSTDIDVAGRVIHVNGTEIHGSVFETDITKKDIETEISHTFLARFGAGDTIVFQFTAGDGDVQISTHGTFGDHTDSSTIEIKKVANL